MYEVVPLKGINGETIVYDRQYILNTIHEVHGKLLRIKEKNTSKDMMLLDGCNSAIIEGAVTNLKHVKENFRYPVSKSDKMAVNVIKALNKVYNGYKINDTTIRGLWEIIINEVCENTSVKGTKYRDGMVYIASNIGVVHTPAQPQDLQKLMGSLFTYIEQNIKDKKNGLECSIISHFYFVYIHPFCDGNGRMTRLLQNYILYNTGYTSVLNLDTSGEILNNITEYHRTLRISETPFIKGLDITPFLIYILKMLNNACIRCEYDLNAQEFMTYDIFFRKRGINSELTSKDLSEALKISTDASRNILNKLVKKGIIIKTKTNNRNIYKLTRYS